MTTFFALAIMLVCGWLLCAATKDPLARNIPDLREDEENP